MERSTVRALGLLATVGLVAATAPAYGPPATPSAKPIPVDRAHSTVNALPTADFPLQGHFNEISGQASGSDVRWSALAVSLDRGDTLFAVGASTPLVPASNTKLLTTISALHYLGPDFRYQTYLIADGTVENETLHGDLILYGTGDPSISRRFVRSGADPMEGLADKLSALGIRRVTGDLVADGSFLPSPGRSPEWKLEDLDDWFAAPVGGLSYNENVVTLRTTPGTVPGAPPIVEVTPAGGREVIDNRAVTATGQSRPDLIITRESPTGDITLLGKVFTSNRPIWNRLPVSEPARFSGMMLESLLAERGIRVDGSVKSVTSSRHSPLTRPEGSESGTTRILATHESEPLIRLLDVINKQSNNFYAEAVFKTLGRVVVGDGSFAGGTRAVQQFLVRTVGIQADQVDQRDGSGLSPHNRASAEAFVQLLTWMDGSPFAQALRETLPAAGRQRGLGRMYRSAAADNLRAKTGTIASVSALSGHVTTVDGERVVFSLISNGIRSRSQAKTLEDEIGVLLAEFRRP